MQRAGAPFPVVSVAEFVQGLLKLRDVLEVAHPEELFLESAEETFDAAVALGLGRDAAAVRGRPRTRDSRVESAQVRRAGRTKGGAALPGRPYLTAGVLGPRHLNETNG